MMERGRGPLGAKKVDDSLSQTADHSAASAAKSPAPPCSAVPAGAGIETFQVAGRKEGVLYHIENDFLSDDWPVFRDLKEAQSWVRERCEEIAEANVDENRIGNCPLFQGMHYTEIVDSLYAEHVESIDERPDPSPSKQSIVDSLGVGGDGRSLYAQMETFSRNVEEGLKDLLNYGLDRPEVRREIEKTIAAAEADSEALGMWMATYAAGHAATAEGIGVLQDAMQYGLRPEIEAAARRALRMFQP